MKRAWAAACVCQLALGCAIGGPRNVERTKTAVQQPEAGSDAVPDEAAAPSSTVIPSSQLNADALLLGSCAKYNETSSLLPSNLLFLVDRSGSMKCNPPPTTSSEDCEMNELRADEAQPSKWELTRRAVLTTMSTLSNTNAMGISYFSNDSRCGVSSLPNVPVAPNSVAQREVIASSFAGITPNGSTPLVGATLLAYKYLHQSLNKGGLSGNSYVVLITDGEQSESCSDPAFCNDAQACSELLIQKAAVAAQADVNIRTFVVGVPGSERGSTVLSRLAKAGGTAAKNCDPLTDSCHFDISREDNLEAALQRALQSVAGQAFTCELELPKPKDMSPVDLALVNVVFTPHTGPALVIPQDLSPCEEGSQGWQYDASKQLIRLCGRSCSTVRSDRGGRIDVVLGCPVRGPD
jgi:hypothetical protein